MVVEVAGVVLIATLAFLAVYLGFVAWRLFRPHRGRHLAGGEADWTATEQFELPPPAPDAFPVEIGTGAVYYPAPALDDPPDVYLERFDALLLATRQRFAAIHEFVDAGFDAIPAIEAA